MSSARSMDPEPSESKRPKSCIWSSSSNFLSAPSKHDDSCLRRRRRCLCAGGLTGTCPGMVACIPAPVLADAAAEHKNLALEETGRLYALAMEYPRRALSFCPI